MDKQERGNLLVEQEDCEHKISQAKKQLHEMGAILSRLGSLMMSTPESVIFSNAPEDLGKFTTEYMGGPSFDWNKIPNKESIAQLTQGLRKNLTELRRTQDKLR